MDRRFLDDCGLETHDSLSNELDTIRSEYFGLDLNNSSDSEGPDVTADETSGISLAGSSTPRNDRVTPVLDQSIFTYRQVLYDCNANGVYFLR